MVSGIINVYKEKGFTSFDVVAKMRGIFHQKKIGHTGTLDPDAEGVLPVCLGKATKVCDLLTEKDKVYETVLLLGTDTDTQDISGTILNSSNVDVTEDQVRKAIASYIGAYDQIPPMYSALKINGQKLCDLARKGITVERKARPVTIYEIEILSMNLPEVHMRVHCSKGTYIRTLCHDIGQTLGCYGCMKSLIRTRVASFTLDKALRLSEVEEAVKKLSAAAPPETWNYDTFRELLYPVDYVFDRYPEITVLKEAEKPLINGNRISAEFVKEQPEHTAELYRLYDWNQRFIGLYEWQKMTNEYKPVKLFME